MGLTFGVSVSGFRTLRVQKSGRCEKDRNEDFGRNLPHPWNLDYPMLTRKVEVQKR
jgi:hypothetical protein